MSSDQTNEERKATAGAKLTKMLIDAEQGEDSDRTIEEIFDSVYRQKGLSQKEIDQLNYKGDNKRSMTHD